MPVRLFYPHVRYHTRSKLAGRRLGENWKTMQSTLYAQSGYKKETRTKERLLLTWTDAGVRVLGSSLQLLAPPKAALVFFPAAVPVLHSTPAMMA